MKIFEIIELADELKRVNDGEIESIKTTVMDGRHELEVITDDDGYWSVYMDNDNYLVTKSVYSMTGEVVDAIDEIIKYIEFKK